MLYLVFNVRELKLFCNCCVKLRNSNLGLFGCLRSWLGCVYSIQWFTMVPRGCQKLTRQCTWKQFWLFGLVWDLEPKSDIHEVSNFKATFDFNKVCARLSFICWGSAVIWRDMSFICYWLGICIRQASVHLFDCRSLAVNQIFLFSAHLGPFIWMKFSSLLKRKKKIDWWVAMHQHHILSV